MGIMAVSQEIELSGHIIDSGIMTQLFDKVMDMGGNFEILVFDIGKKKTDPSYARLRIAAVNREKLRSILSELHRLGARPLEEGQHLLVGDLDSGPLEDAAGGAVDPPDAFVAEDGQLHVAARILIPSRAGGQGSPPPVPVASPPSRLARQAAPG